MLYWRSHFIAVEIQPKNKSDQNYNIIADGKWIFNIVMALICIQVSKLSKESGWTAYQVHKWFWSARNFQKPSMLTKFKESL